MDEEALELDDDFSPVANPDYPNYVNAWRRHIPCEVRLPLQIDLDLTLLTLGSGIRQSVTTTTLICLLLRICIAYMPLLPSLVFPQTLSPI